MSAILGMISSLIANIFSTVILDQLKTEAETYEILDETGTLEHSNSIDDILTEFDGL